MLENVSPAAVFSYFERISSIPRGSGNCGGIADYIEGFARTKKFFFKRDSYNNIIVKKPFMILERTHYYCKQTVSMFGRTGLHLGQMMALLWL